MKIVEPSYSFEHAPEDALERIERIARTCYKSEDRIGPGTAAKLVRMLRDRGHFPMFDHVSASVRIICDRGVSHELVRHRIAAYAQEVTFVRPIYREIGSQSELRWLRKMAADERYYLDEIANGMKPQEARDGLPNSLKTEVVATLDFTAWRHVFRLRTSKAAHPQMRQIMVPLLVDFTARWPDFFDDIDPGR